MQQFTMTKKGILTLDGSNEYQCRKKGHKKFKWEVELCCQNKLDNKGFIIDHMKINEAVDYALVSTSCEILCRRITTTLQQICNSHGCLLKSIKVSIVPVVKNPETKMELLTTY